MDSATKSASIQPKQKNLGIKLGREDMVLEKGLRIKSCCKDGIGTLNHIVRAVSDS